MDKLASKSNLYLEVNLLIIPMSLLNLPSPIIINSIDTTTVDQIVEID